MIRYVVECIQILLSDTSILINQTLCTLNYSWAWWHSVIAYYTGLVCISTATRNDRTLLYQDLSFNVTIFFCTYIVSSQIWLVHMTRVFPYSALPSNLNLVEDVLHPVHSGSLKTSDRNDWLSFHVPYTNMDDMASICECTYSYVTMLHRCAVEYRQYWLFVFELYGMVGNDIRLYITLMSCYLSFSSNTIISKKILFQFATSD